jgi:protein-tyrosine phosphatase
MAPAHRITRTHFDSVCTLYARANAASWNVKEVRYGFADGDMTDFSPEDDLAFAVREMHADWKAGKRVLVRCQAGLNRSGLITALILIRDGYSPTDAVRLIRAGRGEVALCNDTFVRWLENHADVTFWRAGVLSDAA